MGEAQVKVRVGVFLILAHFGILVLLIALYFLGGFLFEEMTTSVALIVPMFAAYTTTIVKHITRKRHETVDTSQSVTGAFVFISFLTPILFVLLLVAVVLLKAFNIGFETFDNFKTMLAVIESAFAVYIGHVIYALFEVDGGGGPGSMDGQIEAPGEVS